MHEWSLAVEIIKSTEKEAKERNAKSVSEVFLEIGVLNNIVVEQLKDSFEIAKRETMLNESVLFVKEIEGVAFCKSCNKSFQITPPFIFCPTCTGVDVRIEKGDELNLTKMTLEF